MNQTGQAEHSFPSTRNYLGLKDKSYYELNLRYVYSKTDTYACVNPVFRGYFLASPFFMKRPSSGTKIGQMGERFLAKWGN